MISSLTIWGWIKLSVAFLLFLSPGLLFLSSVYTQKKSSLLFTISLAFGLSLGFWITCLIWFQVFRINLNSLNVRVLYITFFFFYIFIKYISRKNNSLKTIFEIHPGEIFTILFCIFITAFYLFLYRDLFAGLGSDSMHHTLISSLFISNGEIPKNYGVYAPVQTFSYHFGYHSFVAAMTWLSGIPTRLMIIITGAIMLGFASLAGAAIVYFLTKKIFASLIASAVIGIIYVFPSYSLLWGRYPQLMGTILLMIFLLAILSWDNKLHFSKNFLPHMVIITTAFLYSHYRIFIAGGLLTLIYLTIRKNLWFEVKKYFLHWLMVPIGSITISSPWLIQLFLSHKKGYASERVISNELFYSLERLGNVFFEEYQTWFLIIICVVILTVGSIKGKKMFIILSLWVSLLGILSSPMFLAEFMDPVTLIISSYVPIILVLGVTIEQFHKIIKIKYNSSLFNIILSISIVAGGMTGLNRWGKISLLEHSFVTSDDIEAGEWIKDNTDDSAFFMISTFQFPLNKNLIIGLNGGYWLPVIAERKTIVPPMGYNIERMIYPDAEKKTAEFHNLSKNLVSAETIEILRENGVTHIYLSKNDNLIKDQLFLKSLNLKVIYQNGNVQIIEL